MEAALGMFPLSTVLFPHGALPLHVFEPRYRCLVADCLAGGGEFGVVLIDRGSEVGGGDHRVDIGTVAQITQVVGVDGGRSMVMALGTRRIRVRRWLPDDPYPRAVVEDLPTGLAAGDGQAVGAAQAAVSQLRSLLSELGDVPALPHDLWLQGPDEEVGWALCQLAPLGPLDRQALLSAPGLSARMELLADLCHAAASDVVGMLSDDGG
jgi:Lon protease-like protein